MSLAYRRSVTTLIPQDPQEVRVGSRPPMREDLRQRFPVSNRVVLATVSPLVLAVAGLLCVVLLTDLEAPLLGFDARAELIFSFEGLIASAAALLLLSGRAIALYLRKRCLAYWLEGSGLAVREGVIFPRQFVIPLHRISQVTAGTSWRLLPFGLWYVQIVIPGSAAPFRLEGLRRRHAQDLASYLGRLSAQTQEAGGASMRAEPSL